MKLWRSAVAVCVSWSACAGVEREEQEQIGRIEELERELGMLPGEKQGLERLVERLLNEEVAHVSVDPAFPKIDAEVLEIVPGYPLVVLDAGEEDGVCADYTFTIYLGTTFKGLVKVVKVEEHRSLGVILNEKNPITVGDAASTGI